MGMVYVLLSVRIDIGAKVRLRNKNTQIWMILNDNDAAEFLMPWKNG